MATPRPCPSTEKHGPHEWEKDGTTYYCYGYFVK
jgi:hypothetical protein